jgi:hypothetical protein
MPAAPPPCVPLSVHEAVVERLHTRDRSGVVVPDAEISGLVRAMATARRLGEQLVGLHTALGADASRSPEARALELRQAALRHGERAAAARDAARARAAAAADRLAAETAAPPPPRDALAAQLEPETRAALGRMAAGERTRVISEAIAGNDERVVGAVLRGPGFLAGLDEAQAADIRRRYRQARHPEAAARLERLGKAIDAVDRAGMTMLQFVGGLAAPGRAAEANAAAAKAALEATKESIG